MRWNAGIIYETSVKVVSFDLVLQPTILPDNIFTAAPRLDQSLKPGIQNTYKWSCHEQCFIKDTQEQPSVDKETTCFAPATAKELRTALIVPKTWFLFRQPARLKLIFMAKAYLIKFICSLFGAHTPYTNDFFYITKNGLTIIRNSETYTFLIIKNAYVKWTYIY